MSSIAAFQNFAYAEVEKTDLFVTSQLAALLKGRGKARLQGGEGLLRDDASAQCRLAKQRWLLCGAATVFFVALLCLAV